MDSELARAYIAIAETGERETYKKALELLKQHEEYFASDHCWNYRIASAYYYLDEEGPALRCFEKALEARPGDEDTLEYINDCRRRLALPRFEKNFRERIEEAWATFAGVEAELRAIMDTDDLRERGEEIMEKCGTALKTAFSSPAFEIGFNGEKYELILSAEESRSGLFPLVCFQKQAPESVLEHWNILVGRKPSAEFSLRSGTDEVCPEDVQVWVEKQEDGRLSLGPKPEQYIPNAPYTQFPYTVNDRRLDLVFQMNEGGMSKLNPDWLKQFAGWLLSGQWLERAHPDGRAACLDTVLVGLDYCMGLFYKLTEEDVYFQIFLNPDGTEKEDVFCFWRYKYLLITNFR